MKHHNDGLQEVSGISKYHRFSRRHAILFLCVLCLATMACGIFRSGSPGPSDAVVMRTRLPTFTPTSLPTFTPTTLPPIATEAAVAGVPTTADNPTQDPIPTNTLIPTVEPDEPGSTPITAEPAAHVEAMPTGVAPEPATNTTATDAAGTPAAVVANLTATAASPTA
ncbi:MAG: hypothetical protein R3264_14085, partial [Anaerolineae bacterium]|nr:hypothetical protein [Anaerolineae bacterium]